MKALSQVHQRNVAEQMEREITLIRAIKSDDDAKAAREEVARTEESRRLQASLFWTRLNRNGRTRQLFWEGYEILGHGTVAKEKNLKAWLGATQDEMDTVESIGEIPQRWWAVLQTDIKSLAGIRRV